MGLEIPVNIHPGNSGPKIKRDHKTHCQHMLCIKEAFQRCTANSSNICKNCRQLSCTFYPMLAGNLFMVMFQLT